MEKTLIKKSFPVWIKKLTSYRIYTPVKNGEIWDYDLVEDQVGIDPDFPNTVISPKKIIFPQREVLFEFGDLNEKDFKVKETLPEERPTIFLGVRPCDAKALTLMDKVFDGDFKDTYYWKRRDRAFLVGMGCNTPPSVDCFCLSVDGSPHSTDGLDILLTDLGEKFYVDVLTEKGKRLIDAASEIFQEPKDAEKKEKGKIHDDAGKIIQRQVKDAKLVPEKLKGMFDESFWDDESMSCIRCGVCTYLCPTCHCFDINDEVISSSPLKGRRVRTWDNCQFPDFTMHSSGHNPRPDRASRLRQRVFHKYQYFVERHKSFQCTGCGRCVSKCPVGIDIIEVLNKVLEYGS